MVLSHAAEPANGELIETDLCIVGAGPAGITMAKQFQTGQTRVCLLESGGREVERRPQRRNRGESVGYPSIGSTGRGSGRSAAPRGTGRQTEAPGRPPARPDRLRGLAPVPRSGWPFDRAHLEPWYVSARAVCQGGSVRLRPDRLDRDGPAPSTSTTAPSGRRCSSTGRPRSTATTPSWRPRRP
jgi:choline dehydrogenase-like flavoprotein